jgi:hypothetical protein
LAVDQKAAYRHGDDRLPPYVGHWCMGGRTHGDPIAVDGPGRLLVSCARFLASPSPIVGSWSTLPPAWHSRTADQGDAIPGPRRTATSLRTNALGPRSHIDVGARLTGVRFGEVAALRRVDVDLLRRRLRIERAEAEVNGVMHLGTTKSHQARTVALPPFLSDALGAYMGSAPRDDLLFTNAAGGYLSVTNWKRRVFDPSARRAGLTPPPLRTHDLRHTAASLMIASGATVKAVQHQLGHRSATLTLDRYGHLWPDERDALGEALERLRTPTPADSLRTVASAGDVIEMESRR